MKKYLSLSSYSTFLANVSNTTEGIFFVMLFIILLLIPETIFAVQSEIASVKKVNNYTYKGIAITGYWHSAFDTPYLKRQIDYFIGLGFNAIEFTPTWYQENLSSNIIKCYEHKTINDDSLKEAILYAKKKNFKVNLKPHIEPYPDFVEKLSSIEFNHFKEEAKKNEKHKDWIKDLTVCYEMKNHTDKSEEQPTYKLNSDISNRQKKKCREIMEKINPSFFWRAHINPKNPEQWFKSYEDFLMYYLKIAIETNVDLFTVGTELVSMTRPEYLDLWGVLIEKLKKEKGEHVIKFTYAAHESEIIDSPTEEDRVCGFNNKPKYSNADLQKLQTFWSHFDIASMTVYFTLGNCFPCEVDMGRNKCGLLASTDVDGQSDVMLKKWREKLNYIEKWREKLNMRIPMVFGELGYRSINYGHYKPYKHSDKIFDKYDDSEVFNQNNQATAYRTAFMALENVIWVDGIFIWEEEIKEPPMYSNVENTSYSLIGKTAAEVVSHAFTGDDSKRRTEVPSTLSINLGYLYRYDFDAGSGYAESDLDKTPWYAWSKFRIRPISYSLSSNIVNKVQFGLWFSGATGGGNIPIYDSEYDWDRFVGGTTMKFTRKAFSWDVDMGIGELREHGSARNGRYKSRQEDDLYYLFTHIEFRLRDYDYLLFPKVALDFEGVGVFNSDHVHKWEGQALEPSPYDRRRFETNLIIGVRDCSITDNLRITPEIIAGYGREYGESYFRKAGIGFTTGLNKEGDRTDFVTIRLTYQSAKEEQWEGTVWIDLLRIGHNIFKCSSCKKEYLKFNQAY